MLITLEKNKKLFEAITLDKHKTLMSLFEMRNWIFIFNDGGISRIEREKRNKKQKKLQNYI